jgi:hypothetical protein
MKKRVLLALLLSGASIIFADEAKPVWELGKNPIDPNLTTGKIELVDGVVRVDGENTFALPASVLGDQNSYTIEFEVKRPVDAKNGHSIALCSNSDKTNQTGLALIYYPPTYNNGDLHTNGAFTAHVQPRKLLDDSFTTFTLLVKDKELLLFKNGLLLTATDTVHPSALPLTFGGKVHARFFPQTYMLRNIKIYQSAVFPAGFDQSTDIMLTYSGDQYTMHRAKITNPALPRILVVGDSISIAYRQYVSEHFKDKAYVDYWVGGRWYEPTSVKDENSKVKRAYKGVLANGPYDVVSWNPMTLHMWNPDNPKYCSVENYPANLTEIVGYLKIIAPNTQFLWVRCTPYSTWDASKNRIIDRKKSERLATFNQLSDEIMQQQGIPEVDLWAICEKHPELSSADTVHWPKASKRFADTISTEIEKFLPKTNSE